MLSLYSRQSIVARLLLAAVVAALVIACRKSERPAEVEALLEGEPEQYRATVVHTLEDGERREVSKSIIFRSGEKLRQEWVEGGERRAIIWRPDLGKIFLLAVDARVYTEQEIAHDFKPEARPRSPSESAARTAPLAVVDPEAIDRAFKEEAAPLSVESRALPDQEIDGFVCAVSERVARFADGHVEATRTFRARELSGLALRIETEADSQGRRLRVVTERRNVETKVPPEALFVPTGFKKVDRIDAR
jgi:hypothetical protein